MITTGQVVEDEAFVMSEMVGSVVVPGASAVKSVKSGSMVGRFGGVNGLGDFGNPMKVPTLGFATSAMD